MWLYFIYLPLKRVYFWVFLWGICESQTREITNTCLCVLFVNFKLFFELLLLYYLLVHNISFLLVYNTLLVHFIISVKILCKSRDLLLRTETVQLCTFLLKIVCMYMHLSRMYAFKSQFDGSWVISLNILYICSTWLN